MITRRMIDRGLKEDIIKIVKSPNDDGVVAQIGMNWFYFGGHTAEDYNDPKEFMRDMMFSDVVNDIYVALNSFRESNWKEVTGEYKYYETWLKGELYPYNEKIAKDALLEMTDALGMMFTYDEDENYEVKENEVGDLIVLKDGEWFDDNGELFAVLRSLHNLLYPNLGFRNESYIYGNVFNKAYKNKGEDIYE